MHGWGTRMLLKHYLDASVSKAELSRRFGISRRTIHHWIETGSWTGICLRAGRGTRRDRGRRTSWIRSGDHRRAAGGVSAADGAAAVRRGPGGGLRGRLQPRARLRARGAAAGSGRAGGKTRGKTRTGRDERNRRDQASMRLRKTRGKTFAVPAERHRRRVASMRPPQNAGENPSFRRPPSSIYHASMRPRKTRGKTRASDDKWMTVEKLQ